MNETLTPTERIAARRANAREKAEAEYDRFVIVLADGRDLDDAKVEQVLTQLGRKLSDLDQAVAHLRRRRSLRAELDNIAKLKKEKAELEAAIGASGRQLDAETARHQKVVDEKWPRMKEIDLDVMRIQNTVPQQLRQTAPPALLAEQERLNREAMILDRQADGLTERIQRAEENAASVAREAESYEGNVGTLGHAAASRREAEGMLATARERRATQQRLRDQADDLRRQSEAIEARILLAG